MGRTRDVTYVVTVDEGDEGDEKGVVGWIEGGLVLDGDKLTRVGRSLLLIRMRLYHLRPITLRPGQESMPLDGPPTIHLSIHLTVPCDHATARILFSFPSVITRTAAQRSTQRTPVSQLIRYPQRSALQACSQAVYSYPNPHCLTCRLPHPVHHCQPFPRLLNPLDQDNIHTLLIQRNKSVK